MSSKITAKIFNKNNKNILNKEEKFQQMSHANAGQLHLI
jgi:hypothetical protein